MTSPSERDLPGPALTVLASYSGDAVKALNAAVILVIVLTDFSEHLLLYVK